MRDIGLHCPYSTLNRLYFYSLQGGHPETWKPVKAVLLDGVRNCDGSFPPFPKRRRPPESKGSEKIPYASLYGSPLGLVQPATCGKRCCCCCCCCCFCCCFCCCLLIFFGGVVSPRSECACRPINNMLRATSAGPVTTNKSGLLCLPLYHYLPLVLAPLPRPEKQNEDLRREFTRCLFF